MVAMTLRRMEQRHAAILGDLPGKLDQVLPETRLNFSHVVSQHILFIVRASFEFGFRALAVETPFLLALKWYEFKDCFPLLYIQIIDEAVIYNTGYQSWTLHCKLRSTPKSTY